MSWKPIENFFEDPEVTVVTCETPFFEVITKGRLCLWVRFSKNHHLLTFMTVGSDLSVVWSFRLLCEIDMIISKPANIYFIS